MDLKKFGILDKLEESEIKDLRNSWNKKLEKALAD
jgi:hypothetical protein